MLLILNSATDEQVDGVVNLLHAVTALTLHASFATGPHSSVCRAWGALHSGRKLV